MHVSYGELARIAPESIRMLGFSYGQADDSVEGVVWTQCVLGRGYELLRMARCRAPRVTWEPKFCHSDSATVVDLRRQPAFAFAARLADLAQSEALADATAPKLVMAIGAYGGWIAPYVAFRLARAGLSAQVIWLPRSASAFGEEAPATLAGATITSGHWNGCLAISPCSVYGALGSGEFSPVGLAPESVVSALRKLAARESDESVLAVISAHPAALTGVTGESPFNALDVLGEDEVSMGSLNVAESLERAIKYGMEVRAEDHSVLTGLSQLIRLPNSERSRAQAG